MPRSPRVAAALLLGATLALSACGNTVDRQPRPVARSRSGGELAPDMRPVPVGRGRRFALPALSAAVASRAAVAGLRCLKVHSSSYGAHLELYAGGLVLPLPAGVGIAPPVRRRGVYVLRGVCSYALRTHEPTGVIVVDGGAVPALSQLFVLWGQPLGRDRLAGFRGPVRAFVGGRRWRSSPGAIPLRRHAEIVLEVGGRLPPHRTYLFPPGL